MTFLPSSGQGSALVTASTYYAIGGVTTPYGDTPNSTIAQAVQAEETAIANNSNLLAHRLSNEPGL